MRDNRRYDWSGEDISERYEYRHIANWIKPGASVIDFGCGNGSLLKLLEREKGVKGFGIEISESGVALCKKNGIEARIGRVDVKLDDIPDNGFDFSVCNVTLEMTMYPEVVFTEMKRVSRYQIISIINFAFVLRRMELFFLGRMPRMLSFGYDWFNTGLIHRTTISDFCRLADKVGLGVKDAVYSPDMKHFSKKMIFPNLFSAESIFLLERK